jgi:succinyl-CoA synthetase beta subunit
MFSSKLLKSKYVNSSVINKLSFYYPKSLFKFFDLHEYQSKIILRNYGLPVQKGDLATSPEEALSIGQKLNGELVIKAQVHAGGRGKGTLTSGLKGGVKLSKSPLEIQNLAKQMIGYNLITHQTPKEGLLVKSVLVLEAVDLKKQFYLAILLDRTYQSPVIIVSNEGGVDIEEVAKLNPSAIKMFPVDVLKGLTDDLVQKVVDCLDVDNESQRKSAADQIKKLYKLFNNTDSTQVEINPWTIDEKGDWYLIDAKINIDESASYRQSELVHMKENSAASEDVDANEVKANKLGLNYIGLKGNIGCLVNGAGLAMATMDIITLKNGQPANFLDVGGGANVEQVTQAFEILNGHPSVETILVNIFGGIMRCDVIAKGIIQAVKQVGVRVPVVVRLTGTNAEQGIQILKEFAKENIGKVNFITAKDLDEAADFAVKSVTKITI